ncbi:hypothetical protein [Leisingera sp. JC1]|uniref:hypothetical protein n=1 Tax=Leisingera sp. JC1 TaxID=1855282 RepID=UPI000807C7B2|nr:hypothetical protein [Leisingera sp. JC1]OBY24584.1 hypothetical protein A9D60_24060 [Leisingera sp. JC1]
MRKMGWMLGLLLCSGCVTTELQYKEGITPLQRNRDVDACTRQATSRAPIANVAQTSQRYWVPAKQYLRIPGFADSHSNGTRTVIPGCADKVRAGC